MDSFEAILKRLRVASGYSQTEVASRLNTMGMNVTNKAVSKWEQGTTKPDVQVFLRLCKLYGVSDPHSVFLGRVSSLNMLGFQRIAEYTQLLLRDPRFAEADKKVPARVIRLYDIPASAGSGVFLDQASFVDLRVDERVPFDVDYALRLSGNSMEPSYEDGQIVYVHKQETLNAGEVGIFILNNDVYCKELGYGELISHNDDYAPIEVSEYDAFYILGKVLN